MLLVAVRLFIAWKKAAQGLLNVCLSRHSEAASAWFRKQCLHPHPAKGATESIRWKNLWNYTTQQNSTASKQCQRKQFSILRHSLQHYPFASYLPHFGHHPQARKSKYFHFINKQSMIINIKMRKTMCFCRRKKIKIFWMLGGSFALPPLNGFWNIANRVEAPWVQDSASHTFSVPMSFHKPKGFYDLSIL